MWKKICKKKSTAQHMSVCVHKFIMGEKKSKNYKLITVYD